MSDTLRSLKAEIGTVLAHWAAQEGIEVALVTDWVLTVAVDDSSGQRESEVDVITSPGTPLYRLYGLMQMASDVLADDV